jgi:serine protease Do
MHNGWKDNEKNFEDSDFDFNLNENDSYPNDNDNNFSDSDFDFNSYLNDSYLDEEYIRTLMEADSPIVAEDDADSLIPESDVEATDGDSLPQHDSYEEDNSNLTEPFAEEDVNEPELYESYEEDNSYSSELFAEEDVNEPKLYESYEEDSSYLTELFPEEYASVHVLYSDDNTYFAELFAEENASQPELYELYEEDISHLAELFPEVYASASELYEEENISESESLTIITLPEWERGDVSASELQESLYSEYREQPEASTPEQENELRGVQRRRYSRSVVAKRKRKSRRNSFLKTVCIILVCALLSAASAYLVMEFRINRGDFTPPINHVVIGGRGPEFFPEENPPSITPTIVTPRAAMAPEDLYLMAVDQVVGIRTIFLQNQVGSLTEAAAASGSGFIISYDGYILTNFHVIELGYENRLPITVDLHDGRSYRAEIVGFDPHSDVALIKIEAENLKAATIGDSDAIRVGQTIYAIGNPFGDLVYTMTDGIVSALDRVVTIERQIINTFQFSAAVNTGNSGGPIFNIYGEVIGIVTAKVARQGVEGIGFAIPINDAIDIAVKLIEIGFLPGRALIGITIQTISRAHAEAEGLVVGSRVMSVNPGSAAENAGILEGDIIIGLGDTEITCNDTLELARRPFSAGDTTTITVWRDGEVFELTITFDENLLAGLPQR